MEPLRIGVLAIQGDVSEHVEMTNSAMKGMGVEGEAIIVKTKDQMNDLHGLIIPGGESTTIGRIAERYGLLQKIRDLAADGFPIFGTCAGLALMAEQIRDAKIGETRQPALGILGVEVIRNAFGRQRESFEVDLNIEKIGRHPFRGVFIRAPAIGSILSDQVETLSTYEDRITAIQQKHLLAAAFHPELTQDSRLHELFIDLVLKANTAKNVGTS